MSSFTDKLKKKAEALKAATPAPDPVSVAPNPASSNQVTGMASSTDTITQTLPQTLPSTGNLAVGDKVEASIAVFQDITGLRKIIRPRGDSIKAEDGFFYVKRPEDVGLFNVFIRRGKVKQVK